MVAELDITDQDVTKIAEMIDGEIASLVPEWKPGFGIDESPIKNGSCCQNCDAGYLGKTLQTCGSVRGRFEEITYKVEGSEQCVTDNAPVGSSQSDGVHSTDIWAQEEDHEVTSPSSNDNQFDQSSKEKGQVSPPHDYYKNEIRQELRWFKAKYKRKQRDLAHKQFGALRDRSRSFSNLAQGETDETDIDYSLYKGKHFTLFPLTDSDRSSSDTKVHSYESAYNSCSPVHFVTAKNFYSGGLLPHSLHRATSLPVDATEL